MMPACLSTRSECRRALCSRVLASPVCPSVPNFATILVSTPLTPLWRSPTPELAAASTGTVRPTQQCGAHSARRLLLVPVLVPVRQQLPCELRRLLPLSLTPLVAGCNTPDVTCHICNSDSCHFRLCVMIFPSWSGFGFCSCHASHIMSSCALHLHTSSSHASKHFPRCPFCNPALPRAPARPSCF